MKYTPLIILVALCILLAFGMTRKHGVQPESPLVGKDIPEVVLHAESLQKIISGRVTIVNVFASWCAPCALELPELLQLKEKNIAPIIGIAWKNKADDVNKWLRERGNPYTHILLDEKGDATLSLSLTGVPETFVVGKDGMVAYHTTQPITHKRLTEEIIPLVERLQKP